MELVSYPLVNGEALQKNTGKTVRIIGKLDSINDGSFNIISTDNKPVNIKSAGECSFQKDDWIEVCGIVSESLQITEISSNKLESTQPIDPTVWDQMVTVMNQYPNIF